MTQDALAAVVFSLRILLTFLFPYRHQLFCEAFSENDWENLHPKFINSRVFSGGWRRGTVNIIRGAFVSTCVLTYKKRKDYLFIA